MSAPTTTAENSLWKAAGQGDVMELRLLLGAVLDEPARRRFVNRRDRHSRTALHHALVGGSQPHVACEELLLAHHADPNACDANHDTPLHLACRAQCTKSIRLLISFGADPELRNAAQQLCTEVIEEDVTVAPIKMEIQRALAERKAQLFEAALTPATNPNSATDASAPRGRHAASVARQLLLLIEQHDQDVALDAAAASQHGIEPHLFKLFDDPPIDDPDWLYRFGVKIRRPLQVAESTLQGAVKLALECLVAFQDIEQHGINMAQRMKQRLDHDYGPTWHVFLGESFGSLITHESRGFVYFVVDDIAFMCFKA